MTSMSQNRDLDYTFARHFATLRTALGLTQSVLAQQLGVTERAVQRWEGGTRYPRAEYLKPFLALCIEHHAIPAGQEVEQARTLWKAAHLKVLFNEHWVLGLLSEQAPPSLLQERVGAPMPQSLVRPVDWGEDVSEVSFYGRESELAQLTTWIQEDHCRLIALLGMGGIGKSALAVMLLHQLSAYFNVAVFRSVRDAIPCEELVVDLIQALAPEPFSEIPGSLTHRVTLLLNLLQTRRCLLVLDNVETLLQEGEPGRYRVGYEEYERLFERIATTQHQSCVLLTSREKPAELKPLEGSRAPVRSLHLAGLDEEAGVQILQEKQLRGDSEAKQRLIDAYSGNPLALKIVAETIRELFASEIAPFLAEGHIIFQGVRALLVQQFARLPFLAQSVLCWLAIVREPIDATSLLVWFVTPVPRLQLLEALEDLRRRSLVEHGQQRSLFTLQSVVMEFVINELVKRIAIEVQRREPDYLHTYGLSLASAKEYIRQTQERLIIAPILLHLGATPYRKGVVEQQLLYCLDLLRARDLDEQGYGPTNVMILLQHLKGHLQGLDLSGCVLREANLQGVQMQDASLRGSFVQASSFTDAFGVVLTVAVSRDGAYWALGSDLGDIYVFLGESSMPSLVLHAHNSIAAIAFSPDGTLLATGGRDDEYVKVWDLQHGTLLATMQGQSRIIQGIAFSPDGTKLATTSLDGAVRLWNLASLQVLYVLHSHKQEVDCVAWSPDGQLLASAGDDGICLWDFHSGKRVRTLVDTGNVIFGLAFSPDGRFLVSGGTDQFVKVWNVASGVCLQTLSGHIAAVVTVAWSPDGYFLASGSRDTTIRLWQTHPFVPQQVLLGHSDFVQSIAFTGDGQRLFSGSHDYSVRLWEIASGDCVRLIRGYMLCCRSIAWSPRGNIVAAATSDAHITLWDTLKGVPLRVLQGHTQEVHSITWSPNGQLLASGGDDETIHLWNTSTGECLWVLPSHTNLIRAVSWSPDGRLLACGGFDDPIIRVWDVEKKQDYWFGTGHTDLVKVLVWSPDGKYLASGSQDFTVRLWKAEDGTLFKILKREREFVYDVAWSPDSTQLASCCGASVLLWDVASGTPRTISLDPIHILRTVAWSLEGARLLAGGRGGAIYWFETEGWTCVAVRQEHQGIVLSIRISADGRTAASADHHGVIIIWDIEKATPLHILRPDRPYERLDISGVQGITEAQKVTLRALGAVENEREEEHDF